MKLEDIRRLAVSIQRKALKEGALLSKEDLDLCDSGLSKGDAKMLKSLIEDEEVLAIAGAYDEDLYDLDSCIENAIDNSLVSNESEAIIEMYDIASDFISQFPNNKLSRKLILTQINNAYKEHGFPYVEGSLDQFIYNYRSEEAEASSIKESRNSKGLTNLFKANDIFEAACDKVVSLLKDVDIEENEYDDAFEVIDNLEMCFTDIKKAIKNLKNTIENQSC